MQLKTLQIVWHGKEPVLSVDFQPNSHTLVSGGQDGEVKHWEVVAEDDGSPGVRFLSSYPVNSKSVNCVRFSPAGDMLASAGDKGEVLLWRFAAFAAGAVHQQQQQQQARVQLDGGEGGLSVSGVGGLWRQVGLLRGHCDDVLDLAWAPDGSALLSGGIENNCILWDVEGRKSLKWLQDHGHYVQGVAWDPLGRYIASQSADRTARVYSVKPPTTPLAQEGGGKRAATGGAAAAVVTSASLARDGFYAAATLSKGPLPAGPQQQAQPAATGGAGAGAAGVQPEAATVPSAGGTNTSAKQPLFCDDSLPTFFRRLAWSPDGAFLAAPAGVYRAATSAPVTSTTHIFSRGDWSGPALSLPCLSKGALVVRFCRRLFRSPKPQSAVSGASAAANGAVRLPYRIIMAVASVDSVILYDMQALEPLAVLGGIHFAAVTDLAWSDDGRYLVVASRDGYCTVCSFEEEELGEPVPLEELPPGVAAAVSRAAARRHQERTAAAAATTAAAKSVVAVVAAAAAATAAQGDMAEEQLSAATMASVPAAAAPAGAAPQRRIQPIAISSTGASTNASQTRVQASAGLKRPAEADPTAVSDAADRPKPKRVQPIPLSATALIAAVPAAAGGAVRASSGGSAAAAAAAPPGPVPNPSTAPPSPGGCRRIVPTRVDACTAGTGSIPALAPSGSGAAAAGLLPAGGLSPLQSAAAGGLGAAAAVAAPSRTPLTGGGAGTMLPGMASGGVAPGSAAKMPTPQVLVFGTPPGSSALRDHGAIELASEPRTGPTAAVAAGCGPVSSQPKPKRVTLVPVDRGNWQRVLGAAGAPAAPVQPQLLGPPGSQLSSAPAIQQAALEPQVTQPPQQTACQVTGLGSADGGATGSSGAGAGTAAAVAGPVGSGGGGTAGGGGQRLSVAQLAAMRGAAAARKAAESGC